MESSATNCLTNSMDIKRFVDDALAYIAMLALIVVVVRLISSESPSKVALIWILSFCFTANCPSCEKIKASCFSAFTRLPTMILQVYEKENN